MGDYVAISTSTCWIKWDFSFWAAIQFYTKWIPFWLGPKSRCFESLFLALETIGKKHLRLLLMLKRWTEITVDKKLVVAKKVDLCALLLLSDVAAAAQNIVSWTRQQRDATSLWYQIKIKFCIERAGFEKKLFSTLASRCQAGINVW